MPVHQFDRVAAVLGRRSAGTQVIEAARDGRHSSSWSEGRVASADLVSRSEHAIRATGLVAACPVVGSFSEATQDGAIDDCRRALR